MNEVFGEVLPLAIVVFTLPAPVIPQDTGDRGLRVDVWTIDEEPAMRRLLSYGVDGLMTDRPDVLAGVLNGR
jgi:glycerophosphoryl diester phosphodiesterase